MKNMANALGDQDDENDPRKDVEARHDLLRFTSPGDEKLRIFRHHRQD